MSRLFVSRHLGLIQPTRSLICKPVASTNLNGALNQASQIVMMTNCGQSKSTTQTSNYLINNSTIQTNQKDHGVKHEQDHQDLATDSNANSNPLRKDDMASPEKLNELHKIIVYYAPRFFSSTHPFQLCTKDVVFIDNIRSVRIQGVQQYALQMALIRSYYNIKYSSNKLELLNLVTLPEESSIKIRWRIVSRPGLLYFMRYFYKFHSSEIWNDGLSTLHVNKEGKIYCHICDIIDVEQDVVNKKIIKNSLVNKGLSV